MALIYTRGGASKRWRRMSFGIILKDVHVTVQYIELFVQQTLIYDTRNYEWFAVGNNVAKIRVYDPGNRTSDPPKNESKRIIYVIDRCIGGRFYCCKRKSALDRSRCAPNHGCASKGAV